MTVRDFQMETLPIPGTPELTLYHLDRSGIRRGKPGFGLCLMGGGTKDPNALRWMVERAGHGHGVVLDVREHPDELTNPESTTRSLAEIEGFRRLTTLVVDCREKANHPMVMVFLDQADAIFLPGGDQTRYWETWQGTKVQRVINRRLAARSLVLGGSSAGMHIMGGIVHTPGPGRSVASQEALDDPYLEADPVADRAGITFRQRFLLVPGLANTITETHWSERDRMGRSIAFLARIIQDGLRTWETASVLACDEGVAACIDRRGASRIFGAGTGSAFRITATCPPQVCRPGEPLSWIAPEGALVVQRVLGTPDGTRAFTAAGATLEVLRYNVHGGRLESCGSPVVSLISPSGRAHARKRG